MLSAAGLGPQTVQTSTSTAMAAQVQAQLQSQIAQAQAQAAQANAQAAQAVQAAHEAQAQAAQAQQAIVAPAANVAAVGETGAPVKTKRRRRADGNGNLTVEQKRRICEKHRSTPKITQKDLCRWAKLEFNLNRAPTQPTMSNILKHEHLFKDNVLGVLGSQRKTIRPTRHAHFDQGDDAQTMLADEARLTVLLAANADASDLMEPGVVNTKVLVNSRWENDIHKRLNEDMIEDPQVNEEEFRMPDPSPISTHNVSGSEHLSTDDDGNGIQALSAKDQLKSFRDVIRYLERTGTADARDPQLLNVIDFLKKKQLSLRFDNASNSTLTI
ncbi:hypothetical protein PHYBOEH_007505 [Phytophthora boehmeriae]|uniref:ARS-binding protein 1 N-terminal domain-containing protein n=1 Tax=Phytophthora boehmeriae TaxID=109152 RepID=A0A8T1W7Y1_9STRA|nr:hypothetical protein PHYBOEH_007505 [Phytophthora boehmeriae]